VLPFANDADAASTDDPSRLRIEGRLLDGAGEPVADGILEAWHGDQFARCRTDAEGVFHFTVLKPAPVPGPDGRPGAPHLNVFVHARGLLRHLVTRIYFPDEAAANEADCVLHQVEPKRRWSLIAAADGPVLHFDIHLQGEQETVFFAL
jgi:protocatechuate 3,4-dioxygenase alpha subunit